ncbi:hypothetical protein HMPREF3039_02609 [Akkermansia sp. KLE1798]|nr:hypothetical protein HMPREF3039_02609 [Akkermansia sp. KLE1798]KZA05358.1 hypothetical protein HMPREF1326_00972 [Akkermansia sp. KLE1605]
MNCFPRKNYDSGKITTVSHGHIAFPSISPDLGKNHISSSIGKHSISG